MENDNSYLEGKMILVVEDLDWNFRYLEVLLGVLCKANVLWAKDGREAIDMVTAHPELQVVLMDIQLPEMDGYEATRKIRELRPALPVIAHTAYAMPEEKQRCLDAGCTAYLAKPIRKSELLEELRIALKA